MLRRFNLTALLLLLLTGTGGGLLLYHEAQSPERQKIRDMEERNAALQKEMEIRTADLLKKVEDEKKLKEQFKRFVQNLTANRPVAEIIVRDPVMSGNGPNEVVSETLVFTEVDAEGNELGQPREFPINGRRAHIDAEVIKFGTKYVQENDPEKGRSVMLFRSLYDQTTSPGRAFDIDKEGEIPPQYRSPNLQFNANQQKLWSTFWRLVDDPQYREENGVRIAQGEGIWGDFDFGYKYKISVDANGGPNIVKERLQQSIINALSSHQQHATPTTNP